MLNENPGLTDADANSLFTEYLKQSDMNLSIDEVYLKLGLDALSAGS